MTRRILLVDDEPLNLKLLEAILRPLGYELHFASNGRIALEVFESHTPDLVLLDFVMPGLDGIDVLTHIRSYRDRPHTPVIFVTSHAEREHRLRGIEAGADEFVEKPVDAAILVARVRNLLRLKESQDDLRLSRDELAKKNAALENAQREQRELTEFIVHDLKAPLSVVWANVCWSQEQLRAQNDAPLLDALEDAKQASRRLRAMVEDLLSVSRLEENQFPLRKERMSLTSLLRSTVDAYARQAQEKRIQIVADPSPEIELVADRTLLQRVLENILENSLRYTPVAGRVALQGHGADEVKIAVSNTGPCIADEDRERIFQKFARGKNETSARGNAGLGLYFCRRAVEAHGGQIEVVRTKEWPTSFVIRLPAVER